MTTYYAAVKYPLDASEDEKVKALYEGITMCCLQLVEEFGKGMDYIENALEEAQSEAEYALQQMTSDD